MKNAPKLPEDEARFLNSLDQEARNARLKALQGAGWSLSTLGRSMSPKVPKTTVHFWISKASETPQIREIPLPPPKSITTSVPTKTAPRYRTISPGVPPKMKAEIRALALQARNYRAKTPPGAPAALANDALSSISKTLRGMGVPTAAIAEAAGVSYRAMARRLSK